MRKTMLTVMVGMLMLAGCVASSKLTALEMAETPNTTVYYIGQATQLDLSGAMVRLVYANTTQVLPLSQTENGSPVFSITHAIDFQTVGSYPVTVTKDGISTQFDITVAYPPYADQNPIVLSLYDDSTRTRLDSYVGPFVKNVDIGVFSVFYTDVPKAASGYFQNVFVKYQNNYEDIETAKIGYALSFKLKSGETLSKQILGPSDDPDFMWDYVRVYLYDDVHQPIGHWYRHLLEKEVTESTLMTSIKLTGNGKTNDIDGPISLTAFTYDSPDDFDPVTGLYRGISSTTILISKK